MSRAAEATALAVAAHPAGLGRLHDGEKVVEELVKRFLVSYRNELEEPVLATHRRQLFQVGRLEFILFSKFVTSFF